MVQLLYSALRIKVPAMNFRLMSSDRKRKYQPERGKRYYSQSYDPIKEALGTEEGRQAIAVAMAEPFRKVLVCQNG